LLTGITTKLLINDQDGAGLPPATPADEAGGPQGALTEPAIIAVSADGAAAEQPAADEPGWYALDLDLGRAPGLRLKGDGRFNLDTFTLDLSDVNLAITIDPTTIESLPPQ